MSRIAYVNGRYLPRGAANVQIEDRGYQFADGVYEVCEVRGSRIIDERRHIARLQRSLDELRIRMPMSPAPRRFTKYSRSFTPLLAKTFSSPTTASTSTFRS